MEMNEIYFVEWNVQLLENIWHVDPCTKVRMLFSILIKQMKVFLEFLKSFLEDF